MSDTVIIAGLVLAGHLVQGFVSLWVGKKVVYIADRVEEVHRATNGMKAELVKVTGEAEHAKGVLEGKADGGPN
jgi:uncharacterized protein YunC (DUF1805 family)